MVNGSKKPEKGTIREEDISTLLQRYSIMTVLTLLQEVSKLDGDKIDWNSVALNTATGISSTRECQTLWRHLAYGQNLIGQFDDGANPMDDDSDLEYELEASPAPSYKASAEASACVKVLMASECSNDPDMPNDTTIEAPLTINIPRLINHVAPSESSLLANAEHGTNICIPVHVPKQPVIGARGEKRPNSGTSGANNPSQRKRANCSTEEDKKPTAAVQKPADQNGANISGKAPEQSQRGGNQRKKQGNSKAGTSSTVSEAQLEAARRAVNIALDMPMRVGTKYQFQSQEASASTPNQHSTMVGPSFSGHSLVKAAAVAAGARIATAADASSLLEATRSQNVVHIRTGGNSVIRSSSDVQFMRNNMKPQVPPFSLPSVSRQSPEPRVLAGPVGPTPINRIPENRAAPFNQSKEKSEKHQSSGEGNALRVNLPSSELEGKKSTETLKQPDLERGAKR